MVVGNGLVASRFSSYSNADDFLIFASGVSDSKYSTQKDFDREQELLMQYLRHHPGKQFIYFSTCSVTDRDLEDTPYVGHKLRIETLIQNEAARYNIFRLTHLAGNLRNRNTILNFLYFHIQEGEHFDLWQQAERNIMDIDDVFRVTDFVLTNGLFPNHILNIGNTRNYSVQYIVHCLESFTHKKAHYSTKQKGAKLFIDLAEVKPVFDQLGIEFNQDYLPKLLEKYYPKNDL
jgi:nucleoside-diphosphate-sugar epimerase